MITTLGEHKHLQQKATKWPIALKLTESVIRPEMDDPFFVKYGTSMLNRYLYAEISESHPEIFLFNQDYQLINNQGYERYNEW